MKTYDAVQKAIGQELGASTLNPFLGVFVSGCSYIHRIYRSIKLGYKANQASQNPSKGNAVTYGAALHLVADHSSLKYALSVALAAKCATDLLRETRQVGEKTKELWQTITGQYPVYHPVEWRRAEGSWPKRALSSFSIATRIKFLRFVDRIRKIKECTAKVIWQSFKLSMCSADAYKILEGEPMARFEGYTELVADWESYEEELTDNKNQLLEVLEKGSSLTDKILKYMDASESTVTIVNNLKKHLGNVSANPDGMLKAVNPLIIPGKITPLGIHLSSGKVGKPALPPERFPPWGGQKVNVIPAPKKEVEKTWLSEAGESISNSPLNPIKGIHFIAEETKKLFASDGSSPPENPFA